MTPSLPGLCLFRFALRTNVVLLVRRFAKKPVLLELQHQVQEFKFEIRSRQATLKPP
jgi:hypothetical protein